jgi:hypothetical protein
MDVWSCGVFIESIAICGRQQSYRLPPVEWPQDVGSGRWGHEPPRGSSGSAAARRVKQKLGTHKKGRCLHRPFEYGETTSGHIGSIRGSWRSLLARLRLPPHLPSYTFHIATKTVAEPANRCVPAHGLTFQRRASLQLRRSPRPAVHSRVDRVPSAEAFGQSPPFATVLGDVKNRIEHLKVCQATSYREPALVNGGHRHNSFEAAADRIRASRARSIRKRVLRAPCGRVSLCGLGGYE